MEKRGISSVISVLLLLVMVIIMAGIIFAWSKGITGEAVTIAGQNIALVCNDVSFEFSYDSGILYIINYGNVNIYSMKLILHKEGSSKPINIREITLKWPENGLVIGQGFYDEISFDEEIKEISLIPVLLGDTKSGKFKEYVCESQEVIIELK